MGSLSSDIDSDEEDCKWQQQLQSHRLLIAKRVDYSKLGPALQSAFIFDHEDHEIVRNPFQNPTSFARANAMIDKLLRKGPNHYDNFLQVLGGYYPDVFSAITGLTPPPPAVEYVKVDDDSGEVLSFIFAKLSEKKQECSNLAQQNETYKLQIKENLVQIEKLKEAVKDYMSRKERYERQENDMNSLKQVAEDMKSENYEICMRLMNTNEENSKLREQNMLLRLDNDTSAVKLRTLQNKVRSEHSHSLRLRNKLDTGPNERDITAMQKEIDQLKLKIAQPHDKKDQYKDDVDTRVQILQRDRDEALEMFAESSENLNKLREELNVAEADRVKYLEETELLQFQVSALFDDCEMYKTRRDSVWQQLQEVEKERDQLMKERNEAQLKAQTFMDEKTKYWYTIRQLEEVQDKLSMEIREKDKTIKELNSKAKLDLSLIPGSTDELLLPNLPENELGDYYDFGITSRLSPRRSPMRYHSDSLTMNRMKSTRSSVRSTRSPSSKGRSMTNDMRSDIFHNLVEKDGKVYEIEINGKNFVQTMVEFVGGNETGIFFTKVASRSYAEIIGIVPGMKLLKIVMTDMRELHIRNYTLENAINIMQEIEDSVKISVQYNDEEFQRLQERTKEGKKSGDSFYVRANFSLRKEGYLSFEKGTVLHVVNTVPDKSKQSQWRANIVDLVTGDDLNKTGLIPSYRNCITNSQLLKSYPSLNRPLSIVDLTKLFLCIPYSLVKRAPVEKEKYRPCFFLPQSLSMVLSFKMTTMVEPFLFDLPQPHSVKCTEEEAFERVNIGEAISCKMINSEKHEFVTLSALSKIKEKEKHCILPYNSKCSAAESYISTLHASDIFPIVFHLTAEREKSVKLLLQPEEKDLQPISQDIKETGLMLDKSVPQYVTINLDRCNKLEDAVQQVMERVAEESNKIIWISGKSDVQI